MIETDRLMTGAPASPQEEGEERALRPRQLSEYVGQAKIREQLEIFIAAARNRGEALDHALLFGPPGLGKTTLAHIIAREMGVNLRQTSGPVLELRDKLAAALPAAKAATRHGPDVLNALLALGYNDREAQAAIRGLAPDLALADAIRQALKQLAKP